MSVTVSCFWAAQVILLIQLKTVYPLSCSQCSSVSSSTCLNSPGPPEKGWFWREPRWWSRQNDEDRKRLWWKCIRDFGVCWTRSVSSGKWKQHFNCYNWMPGGEFFDTRDMMSMWVHSYLLTLLLQLFWSHSELFLASLPPFSWLSWQSSLLWIKSLEETTLELLMLELILVLRLQELFIIPLTQKFSCGYSGQVLMVQLSPEE